jgi:catechol 2,3-dioxygenase-like lactoylglutathione lyase family enzyme
MDNDAGPILSISELALWVTDLERSVAFYRDQMGFQAVDVDPGRNAFLRSGDFLLVLFVPADPGTDLAREYLARVGGPRGEFYHAAFRLVPAALDQYAAALRERGTEVRGPVVFATGRRSYFVEDPDEHTFELTDR